MPRKKHVLTAEIMTLLLILGIGIVVACNRGVPFREKFDLVGSPERVTLFYYHGMKQIGTTELEGPALQQWQRELGSWRVRETGESDEFLSGMGGPAVIARVEYPEATLNIYFENDEGLLEVEAKNLLNDCCVVLNWRHVTRENVIALCGGEP